MACQSRRTEGFASATADDAFGVAVAVAVAALPISGVAASDAAPAAVEQPAAVEHLGPTSL